MSNKLKILITGAQGMLGKDMAETFSDYQAILYDKDELDLTNFSKVKKELNKLKPNLIINCAAYTDVDQAKEQKDLANLINAEVVGNLAEICHDLDIILVQISTEYVFDGQNPIDYNEDSKTSAINVYGQSKALGEKLLIEKCNKYYLIRTSWLYGHNLQKGKTRGMNFIDTMLKLANEKDELNIVNNQFSKPTYTKDLAPAIKRLIVEKYDFGIYHLINENIISPYEFAQEIFKIKNINIKVNPISYTEYPTKIARPINAGLANTKFPKLRSWKEALRDYLK
ncbi:dTDP-4-dehydrorhamnose reductase [bacterium]|nr:dTDP-4-dehydrorhamnose reductase [bacterium]